MALTRRTPSPICASYNEARSFSQTLVIGERMRANQSRGDSRSLWRYIRGRNISSSFFVNLDPYPGQRKKLWSVLRVYSDPKIDSYCCRTIAASSTKKKEFGQPRAVQSGKNQATKAAKVGDLADCILGECCSRNVARAGHWDRHKTLQAQYNNAIKSKGKQLCAPRFLAPVVQGPICYRIYCTMTEEDRSKMGTDSLLLRECLSFWKGYRFHDPEKEQQFHEWHLPDLLWFCKACYVINLIFNLMPLINLSEPYDPAFYMGHIPGMVIAGGVLILLSCFPSVRRHTVLCVSIANVLTAASRGALVRWKTGAMISYHIDYDLFEVTKAISGNEVAMRQLDSFLSFRTSSSVLNLATASMVPQILLLASAGFDQSTLWSCVLQPVVFLGALLMSADVRRNLFLLIFPCAGFFLVFVVLLLRMRSDSLTRRRMFILQRYFREALDKAVDSSRKADSVLNHTLNTNMAEAAGLIELFLDNVQSEGPVYSELHRATVCLQRGMRSCRHRRAYVQMAANEYELALEPVRLPEFVGELVGGTGMQVQDFP